LLKKSVYGLKYAPRNWSKTITAWLEDYGFSQPKVDPGIYVFWKAGEFHVWALYVDDIMNVGSMGGFIAELNTTLDRRFNVQNMGPVSWLQGKIILERDCGSHIIKIGQRKYVWICWSAST
jgi:hypothetical protein